MELVVPPFETTVQRITELVIDGLRRRGAFQRLLLPEVDAIYLKSTDGYVHFANAAYQKLFSAGVDPAGKVGATYLHSTIVDVSQRSDKMILGGCSSLQFNHVGKDPQGRSLQFRTYKRSLLDFGDPHCAILGISRVVELLENKAAMPSTLTEMWQRFRSLPEADRTYAIALAGGADGDISEQESSPDLSARRKSILESMQLESQIDLIKLIVRLQDNGFGQFGV